MLVMQAGSTGSFRKEYGYSISTNPTYGELNPNYILYQGEKFEIRSFTTYYTGKTCLRFKGNKLPGEKMLIEVNGIVCTFVKDSASSVEQYYTEALLFTSTSTYTIRILSIE